MPDIQISGCNGFYTIIPVSDAGAEWIDDNCEVPGWAWVGPGFGCDNSDIVNSIAAGAMLDGLEVA